MMIFEMTDHSDNEIKAIEPSFGIICSCDPPIDLSLEKYTN